MPAQRRRLRLRFLPYTKMLGKFHVSRKQQTNWELALAERKVLFVGNSPMPAEHHRLRLPSMMLKLISKSASCMMHIWTRQSMLFRPYTNLQDCKFHIRRNQQQRHFQGYGGGANKVNH
jgi:hypothetical protein